ncbi:glycosyltransferase family A protein [Xiashengella succiniciproducens]|jgi:hypothetical protein|uniref:Glycosyltransferase family 2 protein n=1 Tax=Xiashengella succiniciproducens TaxID=2949635 RepID=A0A9J6ZNS9_9BACT|nr:glycosyltransferase family A protein [Alkaliflexus sp. Ai-910]URW79291.1 glycosyltransferase family 2 protein [Alkaliflexus sp. Ai-910]
MRVGENPLKSDRQELEHKQHRVIIPFWIPNVENPYFRNQPEVLRICIQSLLDSINTETTNITLINNNSCKEASDVVEYFVEQGVIDKYVVLCDNRGKLEAVLSEARACYEEYITISDCDFLFFKGWESSVAGIMRAFPEAGMVSCFPASHLAYFYNSNLIWFRPKAGKILDDNDIDLFEKGLGHPATSGLYSRPGIRKREIWRYNHYYLKRKNCIAMVGAVHALATYRREVVDRFNKDRVLLRFGNGYEHEYIDFAAEKSGYLRLSTPSLLAYHMGNTLPQEVLGKYNEVNNMEYKPAIWPDRQNSLPVKAMRLIFPLTNYAFRFCRKYKLI